MLTGQEVCIGGVGTYATTKILESKGLGQFLCYGWRVVSEPAGQQSIIRQDVPGYGKDNGSHWRV